MNKKILYLSFKFFCFCSFSDVFAEDMLIDSNTIWESGTYTYENISITGGSTLTCNGKVTINANNLTVDAGSSISADGKGYFIGEGPGAGGKLGGGGSYGGKGGDGYYKGGSTYGSAIAPVDLGSGGGLWGGGLGGGAVKLVIEDTLFLEGKISANGTSGDILNSNGGGSGGSLYIITKKMSGAGMISANGGDGPITGSAGGGGRVAIYYNVTTFSGQVETKKGVGKGEDGTVCFVDTQNNIFYPGGSFRFQANDGSFNFEKIVLNNSKVNTEGNVNLMANSDFVVKNNSSLDLALDSRLNTRELHIGNNSKLTLNDNCNTTASDLLSITDFSSFNFTSTQTLNVPGINLNNNSTIVFSGKETLTINNMSLNNNSSLTHIPEGKINLNISGLNIDNTSSVRADGKGYPVAKGPGTGGLGTGGSYGGKGGAGVYLPSGPTYGYDSTPEDLGSGGGNWGGGSGGGAIKLLISDTLNIEGNITANGNNGGDNFYGGGSGGSIYIIAKDLSGQGKISANGGIANNGKGDNGAGGGGGRIALYYKTSEFKGSIGSEGGAGSKPGENGTTVTSDNTALTFFNLKEKSSTNNTVSETLQNQIFNINTGNVTGDLSGTMDFSSFEITKIITGSFAGEGFFKAQLQSNLDGISYQGICQGMVYADSKENKICFKGELEGEINGICDGFFTESVAGSGIFDKYQFTWKINRLNTNVNSVTIISEGTLTSQSVYSFNSELRVYQGNFEGSAYGLYTGPLNAVLTHIRITSENQYQNQGFSIVSCDSSLGQSQGYSYNQLKAPAITDFQGLFESPILGKLAASFDESKSPKTFSGTVERLDLGSLPQPELKVKVWGSQRVSSGQKVAYIIEYRNDGSKAATEAIVYNYLDFFVNYVSASEGAYYNNYAHRVAWNLGRLSAKSVGYLNVQAEVSWGLPWNASLENRTYILDIILNSSEENGVVNGILFDPFDMNGNKDFEQFVHDNNAKWFKLYKNTNFVTGPLEAYLASKDMVTPRNGVGQTNEIVGYKPKWLGLSGGATTLINQAIQERISGQELYLVTPQVVTQEYIQRAKKQFNKIIIYQGDDIFPNITYPLLGEVTREVLIKIAKELDPPDNLIENLLRKIEDSEHKILKNLVVLGREAGNKIRISWEDNTVTEFNITNELKSEDNVTVITIPGIRHEEWIPLLNLFRKRYNKLPVTDEEVENLKKMLRELRISKFYQMSQHVLGAHDPNELLVLPEGPVKPGTKLFYTINFENEGEGIAYGVYITDTLEEDLDVSTLNIGNGGIYDAQTRTIKWFIGELASKQNGSVTFSINVNQNAIDKSEVINFATVYFPSVPEETRTNGTVNRITTLTDNIAPITTIDILPVANQSGWNNTDVSVILSAKDNEGGSGLAKTEYSLNNIDWSDYSTPFAVASEGTATVCYKSSDNANNIEFLKLAEIKIDKTLPQVNAYVFPPANSLGWNNTDVTVTFSASDTLSGIASVTPAKTITSEGANQYIGGEAIDLAGNESNNAAILNIDKTTPKITINLPENEKTYMLNQIIYADWSAIDYLSGIDSITATVPNNGKIDLSSVGIKKLTVKAKDKAGNEAEQTISYNVIYSFSGILAPIRNDGRSIFKLGSTIPIKFNLKDGQGNFITNASAKLSVQKFGNNEPMGDPIEAISTAASTTGNLFRYDNSGNQYIFNLSTKALSSGAWQLQILLDDGSLHTVFIGLK